MKKIGFKCLLAVLVAVGMAGFLRAQDPPAAPAQDQAQAQSFTGMVTDNKCGASHEGDAKACVLKCIDGGAQWALAVGDTVYTLSGKTDGLKDYAGGQATVTGTLDSDSNTITVTSVAAPSDGGQ